MQDVLVINYKPAGKDYFGKTQYEVYWTKIGQAATIEEAKKLTPYPVLG